MVEGDTLICVNTGDAGGSGFTVSETVALCPAALAVIVDVPGDTPVASPALSTLAAELELLNSNVTPGMTLPCWSLAIASNRAVAPTTTDAVLGETETLATTDADDESAPTVPPPPQPNRKVKATRTNHSGDTNPAERFILTTA